MFRINLPAWALAGDQFVSVTAPSADFDEDGDVDGQDFLAWQRGDGDADGNGVVDAADLAIWTQQFGLGESLAANSAVPEPTACALFLTFLAVVGGRQGVRRAPLAR
jgi:hypothetical protein